MTQGTPIPASMRTTTGTATGTATSTRAVVTFLTPAERPRVEAAGSGCFTTVHRESVEQLLTEVRTRAVSAVLVSVNRYQQQHAAAITRLVREFPAIPAVALLTGVEPSATRAILALGQHGVQTLVDAREPMGWRQLRTLVTQHDAQAIDARATARVLQEIPGAGPACQRFISALFSAPNTCTTVVALARSVGVPATTFMSRFLRAGLPPARRYLAYVRLVRAAHLFENPGRSITHVAFELEYSSPQSFSRHLRGLLGIGALEFRRRYTADRMLHQLCEELIRPHVRVLRDFDPFFAAPQLRERGSGAAAPPPRPAPAP